MEETKTIQENSSGKTLSIVLFVLALIYLVSPIDIIPDAAPIVGWLDDAFLAITASLNLIQKTIAKGNETLVIILKYIKFITLGLGIIIILLILILGGIVYSLLKLIF